MTVATEMARIAAECARTPGHISVWSESLGKYVCSREPEFRQAVKEQEDGRHVSHAPINPAFKLVFLTSVGGTLLFVIICVATTLLAGKTPPPLIDKTVTSLFDLAKIGFGAVVGLLGGQTLKK